MKENNKFMIDIPEAVEMNELSKRKIEERALKPLFDAVEGIKKEAEKGNTSLRIPYIETNLTVEHGKCLEEKGYKISVDTDRIGDMRIPKVLIISW